MTTAREWADRSTGTVPPNHRRVAASAGPKRRDRARELIESPHTGTSDGSTDPQGVRPVGWRWMVLPKGIANVARSPYLEGEGGSSRRSCLRYPWFGSARGTRCAPGLGPHYYSLWRHWPPSRSGSAPSLSPVRAIRGNNDKGAWASSLPTYDVVAVGSHAIYAIHNLAELDLDPADAGFIALVSGHPHKPVIERCGKTLFANPGSAGPWRFTLPVTVATLALRSGLCEAKIVELALSHQSRNRGPSD